MTGRRAFLKLTLGTTAFGVTACIPEAPERSDWRDRFAARDAGPAPAAPRDAGETPVMETPRDAGESPVETPRDGGPAPAPDAGFVDSGVEPPPRDGGCETVMMHDTYAQALYYDGTYGPLTGTVTVDHVLGGVAVELEFWHGHGGQNHRYTITPENIDALKRGERVTVETTEVDSHRHTLFVDPLDEDYRVPGAPDVPVPLC